MPMPNPTTDVVEDIAFIMDEGTMVRPVALPDAFVSAIRIANRNRVRHPGRSKADLIEASFDALMGEC